MKTIVNNNFGCSPVQQESCIQIHGGSGFIESIGYAIAYVARCYSNVYQSNPYLWDKPNACR
jgi:hypothetical protein